MNCDPVEAELFLRAVFNDTDSKASEETAEPHILVGQRCYSGSYYAAPSKSKH